jgi:hypothetical protein
MSRIKIDTVDDTASLLIILWRAYVSDPFHWYCDIFIMNRIFISQFTIEIDKFYKK